jgi:hypothetical protein
VYCVVLGKQYGADTAWPVTPREMLIDHSLYPYPFGWGTGWPKTPPD